MDVNLILQPFIDSIGDFSKPFLNRAGFKYIPPFYKNNSSIKLNEESRQYQFLELKRRVNIFKPSWILAASDWTVGLIASEVAREKNLPFAYEVRGFWEISRAEQNPAWRDSAEFKEAVVMETRVAKAADKVFTINRYMKEELVRRGVSADRIELVPNGFDGWPEATQIGNELQNKFRQRAKYWVGYIGSFGVYEGLDDLLLAVSQLRHKGFDVGLLLVGSSHSSGFDLQQINSCPMSQRLQQQARLLGIEEYVVLPGRQTPENAAAYYEVLDVVVIPRKPVLVSELVSPIKPIEAASHGKRVLMSNVAPLAELSDLYPNFFYFEKGNLSSLVSQLIQLLQDLPPELPRYQGLESRLWSNCVRPMVDTFKQVK